MNDIFKQHCEKIETLFAGLDSSIAVSLLPKLLPAVKAIYVFIENGKPVHVGRTRNLKSRVQGHITNSHYSASFAFKRARASSGYEKASYSKSGSRNHLVSVGHPFLEEFLKQIELVKQMQVKYLSVEDPIDQYLLELYAALEYGTSLTEFDTH